MDLEGISTNGKDEVIEGKRLPSNRFPKSAGYIKDEIVNGKKMAFVQWIRIGFKK